MGHGSPRLKARVGKDNDKKKRGSSAKQRVIRTVRNVPLGLLLVF
jgi:hypothetical protein